MEGSDQLAVAQREHIGKGTVGVGDSRNQCAIASSGGGQVGNGVDSFLSIDMVGGLLAYMIDDVVAGTSGGGL